MPTVDNFIFSEESKSNHNTIKIKSKYELTIESWFEKFVADEVYPDYSWDKCGKVTNWIMKTTMSSMPKYLIIQLMRFESDKSYVRSVITKNDQFVHFPTKDLDLSSVSSVKSPELNWIYDLYGVIHHSGTMDFGHYYATIRSNINSENWHMFSGKNTFEI